MPSYPDRHSMPPNPDPNQYILVETKEGCHYRRKRGKKTKTANNAVFQANEDLMKIASPAAKSLLAALLPYRHELESWRVHARFTGLMRKGIKARYFSNTSLKGAELQKTYHLDHLLKCPITVTQPGHSVVVQVPLRPGHVHRQSSLVSDFYLEAILVVGDPFSGAPLKVESTTSTLYSFNDLPNTTCTLHLPLSGQPWLLFLKFCSLEGNELAQHPKHYGMKLVEVGS